MRRAAAAAVAGLLAFAAFAPTPALGTAGEEGDLLSLVNGLRSSRGLRPVSVHPELQALADDWARRMAAAHNIFHSPLNARVDVGWVRLGENVAVDLSVVAAERTLEASPEHLANLVSPFYDYIGIGVAHGADGGTYVVQEFMQLAAPLPSGPVVRRAEPRQPTAASGRRSPPRPLASPPPPTPSPRNDPPPPPLAPRETPGPSVRLTDVFVRLRGLDFDVTPPPRDYGLVRRNW